MNGEHVVAIIPSNEKPPRYVIDESTDGFPVGERPAGRPAETALDTIGRAVCSRSLGVNFARFALNADEAWVYETKPIDPDELNPGYTWTEGLELHL